MLVNFNENYITVFATNLSYATMLYLQIIKTFYSKNS